MRVNSAKDDAASLAIGTRMEAQIRGKNQGVRNVNDGISLAQVAEGGMQEAVGVLQRMRELAVQAANDTYSSTDRTSMELEITQLKTQLNSIASNTEFNGQTLLDGTFTDKSFQIDDSESISFSIADGLSTSVDFSHQSADGWETYNGNKYKILGADTWVNSQISAQALGGDLVTVDDAAENAWLLSTFASDSTNGIWIGYNDSTTEGVFEWVSGENPGYDNFLAPPVDSIFETESVVSTTANGASTVYATDMDGDGDIDILSASANDNKIAWYENDGSENFTENTITTSASSAISVYATDIDGDGDVDVLSASNSDDKIAWYENDGSENFTSIDISTSADGANTVYATDMDGDGDIDVLSASEFDDKITWYENDGSENFTTIDISTSADGARSVYATDMDGDGDIDVLSASRFDNKIAWYENDGSENFTTNTITTAASSANSVYATDMDGDGDIDVLSASFGDNKIAWYENDGSENFTTNTITTAASSAWSVYATDMDSDGDIDVLSASQLDDTVSWYENDGSQNFVKTDISTSNDLARDVYATDVDGDGDVDVLSASYNDDKIAWYAATEPDYVQLYGSNHASPGTWNDRDNSVSSGEEEIQGVVEDSSGSTVGDVSVLTQTLANTSISILDGAIDYVGDHLGAVGAFQNRLESISNNLLNSAENLSAAHSRIMDADIAQETSNLTKNTIIQQAGTAILAQANQQPQIIMQLLG